MRCFEVLIKNIRSHPIFVHSICVILAGILIFAWPFIKNLPGIVVFCLIYGFFSGAFISLPPSSIASTTADMSRFGARLGMAVTCNGFGVLMGPPIAGAIIANGGGYVHAAVFAGIVVTVGGMCLGAAGLFSPGALKKFKKAFASSKGS
jgi:MFS family permease